MTATLGNLSNEVYVRFSDWQRDYRVKLRRWPDHSLEFTVYDHDWREVESIRIPPRIAQALYRFD